MCVRFFVGKQMPAFAKPQRVSAALISAFGLCFCQVPCRLTQSVREWEQDEPEEV